MRRLLLDFGRESGRRERFAVVLGLARALGAEIRCVYAIPPVRLVVPSMRANLSEQEVADVLNEPTVHLEQARADFDTLAFGSDVPADWHESARPVHEFVIEQARYADLAVIEGPSTAGLSDRDVFDIVAGCPDGVLVLPPELESTAPDLGSVMVAWNGSREATRALHASMPILERARQVVVVSAAEPSRRPHVPDASARIEEHLRLHRVESWTHAVEAEPQDMGQALLDAASEVGAGLVVMGAFGHSRTFEFWLGGATRDALRAASVPLLMAH